MSHLGVNSHHYSHQSDERDHQQTGQRPERHGMPPHPHTAPHHHSHKQNPHAQHHHRPQHHQPPGHHPHQHQHNPHAPPLKWHSFKMLVDPMIHRGAQKMIRYDGAIVPGNPHHVPPIPSDPRKRLPNALWRRLEAMELPIPKMKIDENYVGEPPKVEVTIENLNDNVDRSFLKSLVQKYGVIEDLQISFHPVTKKHLGLARLVFEQPKAAKDCVNNLHGKSVMGKQLNCYVDPFSASFNKMFSELTEEKRPEPQTVQNDEDSSPEINDVNSIQPKASSPVHRLERRESRDGDRGSRRDSRDSRSHQSRHHSHHYSHGRDHSRDGRRSSADSRRSRDWDSHHHHSRESSWDRYPGKATDPTENLDFSSVPSTTPHASGLTPGVSQTPVSAMPVDTEPPMSSAPLPLTDPGYGRPEYWMMKAQEFAANAAGFAQSTVAQDAPQSGAANLHEAEIVNQVAREGNGSDEDSDSRHVDLDTRLKMLMKDRTGSMPAFLLDELNGSESEKEELEEGEMKEGDSDALKKATNSHFETLSRFFPLHPDEVPLDRAPSPFLSSDHYLQSHKDWLSEKRNLEDKNKTHRRPTSRNSDQMSLSSLSSAENNILEQGPNPLNYPHLYPYYPPPPGHWDPNMQYAAGNLHPAYQHPYDPNAMYAPPEYSDSQGWLQDHYGNYYQMPQENTVSDVSALITQCLNDVVDELKRILRKDIQKRMCETIAFYLYDKWWDEREEEYKKKIQKQSKHSLENSSKQPSSINSSSEKLNSIASTSRPADAPKAQDLNTIFDKQREKFESAGTSSNAIGGIFGMGGSLGFGFRGTIPKLPSFKKKRSGAEKSNRKKSDSTDEEEGEISTSSKTKKISEKRKEQEKRREHRLEKLKEKDKKSEDWKKDKSKDSRTSKKQKDAAYYSDGKSNVSQSEDSLLSSKATEAKFRRKLKRGGSVSDRESSLSRSSVSSSKSSSPSYSSSSESSDVEQSQVSAGSETESTLHKPSRGASSISGDSDASLIQDERKKKVSSKKIEQIDDSSNDSRVLSKTEEISKIKKSSDSLDVDSFSEVVKTEAKDSEPSKTTSGQKSLLKLSERQQSIKLEEDRVVESPTHMLEHDYAKKPESEPKVQPVAQPQLANDHGYTKSLPSSQTKATVAQRQTSVTKKKAVETSSKPSVQFKPRSNLEQREISFRFFTKGLDLEDIGYLKRSYEMMLNKQDKIRMRWLDETHWVDHTITDIPDPPKKKRKDDFSRPHLTGSCRTEGYYKMDPREKARTKYHLLRSDGDIFSQIKIRNMDGSATKGKMQTGQSLSREARSVQRRQLAVLGDDVMYSDLLKFNQLKFRRKQMIFGKSAIHDWGLFAQEDIGADEMVIEYVGHVIRPVVADVRENRYEKQGIGSSYLFRIDQDYVVDATKRGNLARFINHSCDPNCYAKVITVDQQKKIVIYSKQPIAMGEEITYDYKFEIEDEKIRCLCGAKNCRKYLN